MVNGSVKQEDLNVCSSTEAVADAGLINVGTLRNECVLR